MQPTRPKKLVKGPSESCAQHVTVLDGSGMVSFGQLKELPNWVGVHTTILHFIIKKRSLGILFLALLTTEADDPHFYLSMNKSLTTLYTSQSSSM